MVYPDSYMIEIVGADAYLHTTGAVRPVEKTTTHTLTFTAYVPAIGTFPEIGFVSFGVPITISSVTVDFRGVYIDPIYDDNIVTWNVYKLSGWTSASMDGYYDDASGGIVRANYMYEGNVTENTRVTMGVYGKIRYEYVYSILGSSAMTLHMWSDKAACANGLTIVP